MKHIQDNENFSRLDEECRILLASVVNRLGKCGVFIDDNTLHLVSEDHAKDCVEKATKLLTDEGVAVTNRIKEIMGW